MIGKTPATGRGFRGIVNYLMRGKKGREAPERVAWFEMDNLAVDHPDLAPAVMRATANRGRRCKAPVYHLVISWHRDEKPTPDLMCLVGRQTLEDIGLAEHQRILLAHEDTGHKHLHIVVNRVHGDTGKAWDRWQDWVRIEKSLRRQSEAMGMPYVPGRHNDPIGFKTTTKKIRDAEYQAALRHARPRPPDHIGPAQLAARKERLIETIGKAKSWAELDRALAADQMALKRKGQGLVILTDDGFLKLSELKKDIRLRKLEDRFNERFEDYAVTVEQQPDRFARPSAAADSAADDQTAGQSATPTSPHSSAEMEETSAPPRDEPDEERSALPVQASDAPSDTQRKPAGSDTAGGGGAVPRPTRKPRRDREDRREVASDRPQRRDADTPNRTEKTEEEKRAAERDKQHQDLLREAERQALREERRRAREAAELRERQVMQAKADAEAQRKALADAQPLPPAPEPQRDDSPELDAEAAARKALSDATDEADLSFKLHSMGLMTRKQLARAVQDRERAKDAADAHKTGADKLKDEVRDALKPDQPPRKPAGKSRSADRDPDPPKRRRGR